MQDNPIQKRKTIKIMQDKMQNLEGIAIMMDYSGAYLQGNDDEFPV